MKREVKSAISAILGEDHFVDARSSRHLNHDGQTVEWVDVIYRDLELGPKVAKMTEINDLFWGYLEEENVTPVLSFIDVDEDRPLEAAE